MKRRDILEGGLADTPFMHQEDFSLDIPYWIGMSIGYLFVLDFLEFR